MKGYGNNFESEVLFVRESQYVTDRIAYDQYGTPTIYLTEEAYGQQTAETQTAHRQGTRRDDKRNNTGEPRTRTHTAEESQVQSVRTPDLENVEMQSALSAGNSEGDNHGEGVLQRVQAEVSTKTSSEGFNKQYKNMSRWLKRVNSKEEQSFDSVDEDKVHEQSRTYLNSNKENTNEREETRDNFYRRSNAEIRTVRERGQTAYGYRGVLPEHVSRSAKAFASEVQKHGIQVIVHNGLEFNKNGITKTNICKASTVAGDVIYVKNDIDIDPLEAAGHEMFHFWKKTARRQAFTNVLEDNIVFSSQDFMDFQSQIAELYFKDEVGINDDNWLKLAEEIFSYMSGIIHSGDPSNIVRPFLRNYDEKRICIDLSSTKPRWKSVCSKLCSK